MRTIIKPTIKTKKVFKKCRKSISNRNLRERLLEIKDSIIAGSESYDQLAYSSELFSIPENSCANDEVVLGSVTKLELKKLYNQHMLGRRKPARKIYEMIKASAPHGRCPFCGFGQADTLDHYLPKNTFPIYSVTPINLVPSCQTCNGAKNTNSASLAGEQVFHPYYDENELANSQWLFAELVEGVVCYHVVAPDDWSGISKERAVSHFDSFNLGKRFSIEATNELTSLCNFLKQYFKDNQVGTIRDYLVSIALSEFDLHKNSWKTAMYQTLSENEWFYSEGYLNYLE